MTNLDLMEFAFLLGAASGLHAARSELDELRAERRRAFAELRAERQQEFVKLRAEQQQEFEAERREIDKLCAELDEERLAEAYLRGRRDALKEMGDTFGLADNGETERDPETQLN